MIVFIAFWKFDLGKRMTDKLIIQPEWKMLPVLYYVATVIGGVAIMVIIWKVLDVIPKLQAATVARTKALIKPTELFSIENEARKTLSQIIGGFVVIIGLLLTGANLAITQREAERNRSLALEGQITDRFTKAITQLDSKNGIEVRLGGIYALERIAKDSKRDHWTIMEILTAYVRENASREKQGKFMKPSSGKRARNTRQEENAKLPTDIQAVLTVIGRRKIPEMGETGELDLKGTILPNVDLVEANLSGAHLGRAILLGANLSSSNLAGAYFSKANLRGAYFIRTNLAGAYFDGADLRGAYILGTNLAGAVFFGADFRRAHFSELEIGESSFGRTDLSGANLSSALNLTWQNVSQSIIDDETKLPNDIESQHQDELRAMREQTKRARANRKLTEEQ
jgi:uncharacterized protein YjbI with pentapeptide repeats